MGIGFGGDILIVAQEGFQIELTAIELGACSGVTITDNTLIFGATGANHSNLCQLLSKRRII